MNSSESIFDIAVIGGGIAGAGIAREAALRGLRVVVFEKNTFGSGTSSKSSKLIHGGIRYLELAWNALKRSDVREAWKNFHFVFSSLAESAVLEKIAPDLIRPLELVIPIYKNEGRNVGTIYLGTLFYGLLSFFCGNQRLPKILWKKEDVLKLLPNLNSNDLVGGVRLWDHITDDKQLVEETMHSAIRADAETHEHAFVKTYAFQPEKNRYQIGVEENSQIQTYFAGKLIDAGGPWVDKIRARAGEKGEPLIMPVAGSHIMLKKFLDHSVILNAEDKRVFFVINIGEYSRVGTTERMYEDPDTVKTLDQEVEYLLCALERYFPNTKFKADDILSKDSGIRPLAKPQSEMNPHAIPREHEIRIGPTGVMHVLGVKLTDHRRAAKDVVDRIVRELKFIRPQIKTKSRTHQIPL